MATNTIVLLLVTALAALVLAGVLALVVYKTRTPKRGRDDPRSGRGGRASS